MAVLSCRKRWRICSRSVVTVVVSRGGATVFIPGRPWPPPPPAWLQAVRGERAPGGERAALRVGGAELVRPGHAVAADGGLDVQREAELGGGGGRGQGEAVAADAAAHLVEEVLVLVGGVEVDRVHLVRLVDGEGDGVGVAELAAPLARDVDGLRLRAGGEQEQERE